MSRCFAVPSLRSVRFMKPGCCDTAMALTPRMESIMNVGSLLPMGVVLFFSIAAGSAQTKGPFEQLFAARSIRCQMTTGTQADWDSGKLKLTQTSWSGGMVTFDSIRHAAGTDAGSARIVGNSGAGDVQVKMTPAGITLIEETLFGGLNITTVFANYDSPATQRYIAVASRHLSINGPFPSQYHGTCTILQ
jgi:hypothetical protein